MKIHKTTGIILSSTAMGEADILCNVLTRDAGKGKFLYKGLRKSKRRAITASEPGSFTTFQYYFRENRDTSIISDFTVDNYHPEIRKNLKKIYNLYLLVESADKTIGAHEADSLHYNLLSSAITALSTTAYPTHLTAVYLLHLLKIQGLFTLTNSCKKCGSSNYTNFIFDPNDLSIICNNCINNSHHLDRSIIQFITESFSKKFDSINQLLYEEQTLQDLIFHLVMFIENYFSVKIKSKEFVLSRG